MGAEHAHGQGRVAADAPLDRLASDVAPGEPANVSDYERLAAGKLPAGVLGYFAGGAGDERTLTENVAAFGRWQLRPRVLVDVSETTTETSVLGTHVSMPLLVAPVALQRLLDPEGEVAAAGAAARAGTIFCLSTLATAAPAEVAAGAAAGPRWMQVYCFRDRGITRAIVDEAVAHGFGALVLTVDAPRAGRRERDLHTGFEVPADISTPAMAAALGGDFAFSTAQMFELVDLTLSWADLERFVAESPVPVVLKGIQTGEDARLACEHGVAGIVVSNHGGRQLDGVAATIDILPECVEAVDGRIEVLMDGGVRRGTDVLTALALGARAVLAGRAVAWGLAVDGEAGALRVLELLHGEIALALALLGCTAPEQVTRAHLARAKS